MRSPCALIFTPLMADRYIYILILYILNIFKQAPPAEEHHLCASLGFQDTALGRRNQEQPLCLAKLASLSYTATSPTPSVPVAYLRSVH